jgi:hypothetical protein
VDSVEAQVEQVHLLDLDLVDSVEAQVEQVHQLDLDLVDLVEAVQDLQPLVEVATVLEELLDLIQADSRVEVGFRTLTTQ